MNTPGVNAGGVFFKDEDDKNGETGRMRTTDYADYAEEEDGKIRETCPDLKPET